MAAILALPRLGETMEEGRVAGWLKRPGDSFRRGETIVEIETDKTVVELPAFGDGVLVEILAAEGAQINVGEPLCRYEAKGEGTQAPASAQPAASAEPAAAAERAVSPAPPPPKPSAVDRPRATPLARRLARQGGVDINSVQGTGRRARIQARDVEAAIARDRSAGAAPAESAGSRFCAVPAGRVAYRVWNDAGTGAPLLLLHGFGGDAQTWAGLAAALARKGRRVVAPDLPAHGATDFEEASLDGLVDAIAAFIDRLALGGADLVGHSLGGAVAMRLAARLGARLGRVTLIAPAGLGSAIDADFIDGMAHAATGGGLAHLLRRVALRPPVLSPAQLEAMAASLGGAGRLRALAAALVHDGRQQIDIVGDLVASGGRARLVWGLEDRIIPWIQATGAGSATPVHFIPEAGHMPQWDQPQSLAALIA